MSQLATNLTDYLSSHPYLAILILFLVAFGEAMLFIGLFVPSTPIMIGAGALVGLGKLSLFPVLIASATGAIAGDALSFWIGRRGKRHLTAMWPLSTHPDLLATGERFFARHGALSIFLARFVPVVKAVLPTVAGMAGMSPGRFALVNVVSAFVWSAAHLFPSMLIGRGLGVAATANPKVIELFGAVLVLAVLAWIAARQIGRRVVPVLADLGRRTATRWAKSGTGWRSRLGQRMMASDRASGFLAETLLVVAAGAGLIILTGLVLLDPALSRADAALSGWFGARRTDLATRFFLGATMLADWRVLFPLAVAMMAWFAMLRDWRLVGILASAFAATLAFVQAVKFLVQRARPTQIYNGAEAFSFPSGHATHATVILGIAALLIGSYLRPALRNLVYGAAAALVLIVAVSRVYLGAHWPTDVLAGMLFGTIVLVAFAVLTRDLRLARPQGWLAAMIAVALAGLYGTHLVRDYGTTATFYKPGPAAQTVARADWLGGKVAIAPARILLDGGAGEPILMQTDLPLADLVPLLQSAGWLPVGHSWLAEVADSVLPTKGGLDPLAPWPMTHLGKAPLATLVEPANGVPPARRVLRVWDSGLRTADPASRAILVLSATTETLEPFVAGFAMLDSEPLGNLNIGSLVPAGTKLLDLPGKPAVLTKN
ncbi:MAG: bifunctional DedA family/phosphatase PAP2 family protein [Pseudomonadota bacterium]